VPLSPPECPVICNLEAREVTTSKDVRETLTKQVTGPVRWAESMVVLLERGHRTFVELGPGGVLAGLMRRIDRSVKVMSAKDWATIGTVAERLNG
jgi:[acyl-carrier-protein] S-malonyltransferase